VAVSDVISFGPYRLIPAERLLLKEGEVVNVVNRALEPLYCTQGPYAAAANNEQITHAAWQDKPSWFVMGEQDYMLTIDLERDTAKRIGAHAVVLQSSHVPMISHPREVADFIVSVWPGAVIRGSASGLSAASKSNRSRFSRAEP
jgi:hypothetical protein